MTSALDNLIGTWVLSHLRINSIFVPQADSYVLPSAKLRVRDGGIVRPIDTSSTGVAASDHFLVWIEVTVE